MQQVSLLRNEKFLGLTAVAIVTIVSLIVAYFYTSPPNERTLTFYTNDAASVHVGDTVRIAGIVMGKVDELSIERDQVRVQARVKRDAFIGDQSQIQVRMLTVVGGYYVTVIPLGDAPLGDRSIPMERVTMPYNLMQALADTPKITENVDTKPIKDNIDQLQQGLRGANVHSISAVLNAGNTITSILEQQRGQFSEILSLSDEYIDRLANYRDVLRGYIRKVAILEQTLVLYGGGFADAARGVSALVQALGPVMDAYYVHRADFLEKIRGILGGLRTIQSRNGLLVRLLGRIHDRMERALDRQNNFIRPELLATDICIPVQGSPC